MRKVRVKAKWITKNFKKSERVKGTEKYAVVEKIWITRENLSRLGDLREIEIVERNWREKKRRRNWSRELRESEGKMKNKKWTGYMRSIGATERRVDRRKSMVKIQSPRIIKGRVPVRCRTKIQYENCKVGLLKPKVDDYGWKERKKVKGCRGWPDVSWAWKTAG